MELALNPVAPEKYKGATIGQEWHSHKRETDAARRAKGVPLERRAALAAPLLDVLQGGHEQQFVKLFCS